MHDFAQVSADMGKLVKEGLNSFKFFLAYSGSLAVTDDQLISGFRRSKELGALPIVSCRPSCSSHYFTLLHSQSLFLLTHEDHLLALICFLIYSDASCVTTGPL